MELVNCQDILKNFSNSLSLIHGDANIMVSGPADPKKLEPQKLIFIHSDRFLEALPENVEALIVNEELVEQAKTKKPQLLISTKDAVLSRSQICLKFFKASPPNYGSKKVHPSATIGENTEISKNAIIGPNVYIGNSVKIGTNVIIQANSVIEDHSVIGDNTRIHALVYIGANTQIGESCEVHPNTSIGSEGFGYAPDDKGQFHRIPHYGKVEIHDRVEIGSNVSIDSGKIENTIIESGVKIDNHCHIAHNVKIGANSAITAGFIIAGSSSVGKHFMCGGRTSVSGHKHITDGVQLAALSTVLKNVDEPGEYAGFPLQKHNDAIKTQASLPVVPKLRRQMKRVLKHLGIEE